MVTKEQCMAADYRSEFHFGDCTRTIGPRGGVTIRQTRVRVSGRCQTWKTRPAEFRLPVKCGLYESSDITADRATMFHRAEDCPLESDNAAS